MTIHQFLDFEYGPDGDAALKKMLDGGIDPNLRSGDFSETPLHVATRRFRTSAVTMLLDHGADIDATTSGGKTAYAHALRRGFGSVVDVLVERGASTDLNDADRLAVAMTTGKLDAARDLIETHPEIVRTGNSEEDRLLADLAGRNEITPVAILIAAGADLTAPALDTGTPLHQAAWFGQPANARLLIDAGAPFDVFESTHGTTPIGWAVHGSRYSGGADEREHLYGEIVQMLLEAGSTLRYPDEPEGGTAYLERLLKDASPGVRKVLESIP